MYIHPMHQFTDPEALHALMASRPLGAWVCQGQQGLIANHVPFFLDPSQGSLGTLVGHISRANTVWRELGPATPSVVMFQGPQTYITPGWYPGKTQHGRVVPTWNYVVAHAHGVAQVVEDRDHLLAMVSRLTRVHEAGQSMSWRVSDAPPAFIDKMLNAIVGIRIPIDRLEGKLKASQDEDLQDRAGTVRGLQAQAGDDAAGMAQLVKKAMASDANGGS